MWLFTKDGFFSVVQKPNQKGTKWLTVRSRNKKDLANLLHSIHVDAKIDYFVGTDYQVRTVISKSKLKRYLAKTIEHINYDNFKHEVQIKDPKRASVYLEVWDAMLDSAKIKISNCFTRSYDNGYFDDGGIWRNQRNF